MKARVHIMLKPDVRDPQGKTVGDALRRMAHEVGDVRFGKMIELDMPEASDAASMQASIEAMCRDLLVNPVIETYRIEVLSDEIIDDPA